MRFMYRMVAVLGTAAVLTGMAVVGAASASAGPTPGRPPTVTLTAEQASFLSTTVRAARTSQRRTGVPASVTIAQAILESDWGRSPLARTAHNYFGMTCSGGRRGPIAAGCRPGPDRFCDGSGCRVVTMNFRVYRSVRDSFRDHGRHLATTRRYKSAYAHRRDANRFAVEIQRAGYATDPRYAESLTRVMVKYALYRHNRR